MSGMSVWAKMKVHLRRVSWSVLALLVWSCPQVRADVLRPLVFLPGILGSRLCVHGSGEVVWGTVLSGFKVHRLVLGQQNPVEVLEPCGLVEQIVSLGPFWSADVYGPFIRFLHEIGYEDGKTLFAFPYDWRKSNLDTARQLAMFVNSQPVLRDGDFDLLAHSMGGLVARLYMEQTDQGRLHVRRMITLGTPFEGSARALQLLARGYGPLTNLMLGRLETIRDAAFSFPSVPELFPDYRFGRPCCRFGAPGAAPSTPLDIYDADTWARNGWLPERYRSPEGLEPFRTRLTEAKHVHDLVAGSGVHTIPEIHFIGTRLRTPYYLYVDDPAKGLDGWSFPEQGLGDGVVTELSAADATGPSLEGARPAFAPHTTLFNDEHVRDTLKLELAEVPLPKKGPDDIVRTTTGDVPLRSASLITDRFFVEHGDPVVKVHLELDVGPGLGQGTVDAVVGVAGEPSTTVHMWDVTPQSYRAANVLVLEREVNVGNQAGVRRVDVDIPGSGIDSVYVEVQP